MGDEVARRWPALDLRIARHSGTGLHDRLATLLADLSPLGVDEGEGWLWRVFFRSPTDRDQAAARLDDAFAQGDVAVTRLELDDEDWARRSQRGLSAVRVGCLVIAPPWQTAPATWPFDAAGVQATIVVEPSTGFGTGHHASTRLLLRAMQALSLDGRALLDAGTGSGILAAAASVLGARRITAVDDDPDAVRSARDTLVRNGLTSRVDLQQADVAALAPIGADVVVANLTSALLVRLAGTLAAHLRPCGHLVLGGFTADQEPAVRSSFIDHGEVVRRDLEDEWVGITVVRGGPEPPTV